MTWPYRLKCSSSVSFNIQYKNIQWNLYRSRIIRFPRSIVQFLWSLSESYLNYGSRICCFPGSIVSFSDPRRKRIEVSLYTVRLKILICIDQAMKPVFGYSFAQKSFCGIHSVQGQRPL
jgi:hypothetical protein